MRIMKSTSSTTILAILALLELQGTETDDDKRMHVDFDTVGHQSALRCLTTDSDRHAWVFASGNSDQIIVRTAQRKLNQLCYPEGRAGSLFSETAPRLAFEYNEHYQAAEAVFNFIFNIQPEVQSGQ